MKTDPVSLSVSRKRARRARSRVVFFLLRRGFRQLAQVFRRYATIHGDNFEPRTLDIGQGAIKTKEQRYRPSENIQEPERGATPGLNPSPAGR